MSLGRLLWKRVCAAHVSCGAPVEPFDEFLAGSGEWVFHPLGLDGVLGIHMCPDRDGDAAVIALPTRPSHAAKVHALELMRAHLGTGRHLYTMAWKNHLVALHINQHLGGEILGFDSEGYIHFKHTRETFTYGQEVDPQAA